MHVSRPRSQELGQAQSLTSVAPGDRPWWCWPRLEVGVEAEPAIQAVQAWPGIGHDGHPDASCPQPLQHPSDLGERLDRGTGAGLLELPQQLWGRPADTERVQDRPVVLGQAGRGRAGIEDLLAGRKGLGEGVHRKLGQVSQHDLLEVEPRVPAAPDRADQGVARVEEHPTNAHLGHPVTLRMSGLLANLLANGRLERACEAFGWWA